MSCSVENCEKTGMWNPVFELRSRKKGPVTPAVLFQLVFCDEHKAIKTLADFMSAEGFTKLAKYMRENGKENPIQRNTTLAWTQVAPEQLDTLPTQTLATPSLDEDLAF